MAQKTTKKCPHCGKEILAIAKKCKYCHNWIKPKNVRPEVVSKAIEPVVEPVVKSAVETATETATKPAAEPIAPTKETPAASDKVFKAKYEYKTASNGYGQRPPSPFWLAVGTIAFFGLIYVGILALSLFF